MNNTFTNYNIAYNEAVKRCRKSKLDMFLSKIYEYGEARYKIEYATRPENTFGNDLLKERITPSHPRTNKV